MPRWNPHALVERPFMAHDLPIHFDPQ